MTGQMLTLASGRMISLEAKTFHVAPVWPSWLSRAGHSQTIVLACGFRNLSLMPPVARPSRPTSTLTVWGEGLSRFPCNERVVIGGLGRFHRRDTTRSSAIKNGNIDLNGYTSRSLAEAFVGGQGGCGLGRNVKSLTFVEYTFATGESVRFNEVSNRDTGISYQDSRHRYFPNASEVSKECVSSPQTIRQDWATFGDPCYSWRTTRITLSDGDFAEENLSVISRASVECRGSSTWKSASFHISMKTKMSKQGNAASRQFTTSCWRYLYLFFLCVRNDS